ncbi:hypothetical protein E2C01_062389 [Portunus trituberculatus]|uniref:Uncharacterized protein n=1 Tax=Portunus trituberculatus TaxID=210409 RepID=A0A5B7HAZ1_PORTR|nr:hypothetical protein [Portunus trituberculatus]
MATFFGQLRSLCSDIDSQLNAIKEDLRHPPG